MRRASQQATCRVQLGIAPTRNGLQQNAVHAKGGTKAAASPRWACRRHCSPSAAAVLPGTAKFECDLSGVPHKPKTTGVGLNQQGGEGSIAKTA